MKFSIRSLSLMVIFASVIFAITFSIQNYISVLLMTWLAVFILPPFVQVGVFTTRGFRQAFFIGAAFGGIPHFILSSYYVVMFGLGFSDTTIDWFENSDELAPILLAHFMGISLALMSGVAGMISYGVLHGFQSENEEVNTKVQQTRRSNEKLENGLFP